MRTYLRAIAFIDKTLPDDLIVSTGFSVLSPTNGVVPRYLWRMVQSQGFVDAVMAHSVGIGYPAIPETRLAELPIVVPPLSEQRAIADYLDRETARIDTLIEKIEAMIEKLQEYRTALITAAVTGQIDVRGEVVREEARA
ncbi:MAG: restriction endonuclease subunit S [Chloroflexota bacterium]|nr:restriction endonuclease subunit S [Chloroflexota bacterium]